MKFKDGIKEKNVIIRCGADMFLPFAIAFGIYIILFGTVSPGGGFQGGVIVASAVLLLYLGYGYRIAKKVINTEVLRVGEAIGASLYVILGLAGIFAGRNFAANIWYDNGEVGDLISAGTITFMGYAVGFKVLTGVGFLILLLLGVLGIAAGARAAEEETEIAAAEESVDAAEETAPEEAVAAEAAAEAPAAAIPAEKEGTV